jgi:dTDP-4-dehydrorhamnose 3,5-epimerase-like enzyme
MQNSPTNKDFSIDGLRWQSRWRMNNGQPDSYVIPFPTTKSANLVYHGETNFDYGHYGIHIGQEDRLTFLGSSKQTILAKFIDCRVDSPTFRQKASVSFHPSSEYTLVIPPGVAHTFTGLEHVHTINDYNIYLPDPVSWASQQTEWKPSADIINIPLETRPEEAPALKANFHPASDKFYEWIREQQLKSLPGLSIDHPQTVFATASDDTKVRVTLYKRIKPEENITQETQIGGIKGLRWCNHLHVRTGSESGIVPLLHEAPFYIVEHGENSYKHDAFGIHLGQEDHLTFVGPPTHNIYLKLVDCRADSPTLHHEVNLTFSPSPRKYLVIPPGVAHAFEGLEKVYTINRPVLYLDLDGKYMPGNDVIDWPLNKRPYPVFSTNSMLADLSFYRLQAEGQRHLMLNPPKCSTPQGTLFHDQKTNKTVRLMLRKISS